MQPLGKLLVLAGIALAVTGALIWAGSGRLGWLGRLPGDLRIGSSFFFPLATCLLISVVLTVLLNLFLALFR